MIDELTAQLEEVAFNAKKDLMSLLGEAYFPVLASFMLNTQIKVNEDERNGIDNIGRSVIISLCHYLLFDYATLYIKDRIASPTAFGDIADIFLSQMQKAVKNDS